MDVLKGISVLCSLFINIYSLLLLFITLFFRYLVDIGWFNQWKKYVGFSLWDIGSKGCPDAFPGPLDNSPLLKGIM
jgi:hypothetical protein